MTLKTFGSNAVDWENRIDFEKLRTERLDCIKKLLAESELVDSPELIDKLAIIW